MPRFERRFKATALTEAARCHHLSLDRAHAWTASSPIKPSRQSDPANVRAKQSTAHQRSMPSRNPYGIFLSAIEKPPGVRRSTRTHRPIAILRAQATGQIEEGVP